MCQRATGCSSPLIAVPQVVAKEDPPPPTTTTSTSTTTTTLRTQKAIALPAYEPSVECDTINDRFTVKMPLSYDGDFLLGWDMMTANCGFTSEDPQGVVYSYKFTECGTQMKLDENDANKFIYENNLRFAFNSFAYLEFVQSKTGASQRCVQRLWSNIQFPMHHRPSRSCRQ